MDLPTQIDERLTALGVTTEDVEEKFVRGTGPGGQKINKVSSTVVLRHRSSGIEVRRQEERSQVANRRLAWLALCEKLEARRNAARAQALAAREKERRRKRTKSPAQKRRMVADKRHRSSIKQRRGRVSDD
ncbi:peptide chain release factor family protein [Synoicihabitans lomoniglobus]|uniref:Peptide chain release factor-like protein n=1 Tax=Synoicihabitans lomoniglobus TaxID=2909285 RepID=A0AAF0CMG6_9BACT|nr:peptide chain release factor-like protein [Opitutaceae bacterium LMO-M01]WED62990.1 peptide chain release factor-like protein [Opitutaceae bacterium LMO-M01]